MSDVSGVGVWTSITDATRTTQPTREPTDTLGKDAFMKLLVAQLKYQNPLEPSDPSQFMAQTAQFTMVEKLEELAKQGAEGALAQRLSTASALVGKQVTWQDAAGAVQSGVVASARLTEDGTMLRVGAVDVPLDAVDSVASPAAAPTAGS